MKRKHDENGQASLELAIIVPILALFAAGAMDIGRVAIAASECYIAADALAAQCAADPGCADDPAAWVAERYPAIAGADASVEFGGSESKRYTHHIWTGSSFAQRQSSVSEHEVTAKVSCSPDWLTPLPDLMASVGGNPDGLEVSAEATATADDTVGRW